MPFNHTLAESIFVTLGLSALPSRYLLKTRET